MQLSHHSGALQQRARAPSALAAPTTRRSQPLLRVPRSRPVVVAPRAEAQQRASGWWNLPPVLPLPVPGQKPAPDAATAVPGTLSPSSSFGSGSCMGSTHSTGSMGSAAAVLQPPPPSSPLLGPGSPRTLAEAAALPSFSKAEESEILWAGYSDLSEQMRQAHAHNAALRADVAALTEAVRALHETHAAAFGAAAAGPPAGRGGAARGALAAAAGAWQAASFLLLFLVVINIAGAIASFHIAASSFTWFGWGVGKAAATGGFFTKPMLGAITAAVPLANSAVVIVFCVQAVKAAWLCLRF